METIKAIGLCRIRGVSGINYFPPDLGPGTSGFKIKCGLTFLVFQLLELESEYKSCIIV